MELILNDIVPLSPRNLVLDDYIADEYEPSVTFRVYWRWEDMPEMEYQYLGTQNTGSTLAVPFDLMGRQIRLSLVGRTKDGVPTVTDVREGVQTVYTPDPLLGIVTYGGEVVTFEGEVVYYTG